MSSSAFPSVIAAVFSTAEQAVTARVVRGRDISEEAGDVVMIGIQTLDEADWNSAGSFQQTMQTFGGNRQEIGSVNGLILAWNGDSDQEAALSTAFGYLASLEAAVRTDPTLGLTFEYTKAEMQAGDVTESQGEYGAAAVVAFAISYDIRI